MLYKVVVTESVDRVLKCDYIQNESYQAVHSYGTSVFFSEYMQLDSK